MGKQEEMEGSTRVCLFSLAHCTTAVLPTLSYTFLGILLDTPRELCVHDDSKSDELDSDISHHSDRAICKERTLPLLPNPHPWL